MKTKTLGKIAGLMIPVIGLVGCSSDTGAQFDFLRVKVGNQSSVYRKTDERTPSDEAIFAEDAEPYDKSEVTNEGIKNSNIWGHYQNRK